MVVERLAGTGISKISWEILVFFGRARRFFALFHSGGIGSCFCLRFLGGEPPLVWTDYRGSQLVLKDGPLARVLA